MLKNNHSLNKNITSDWVTIHEAVKMTRKSSGKKK